MQIVKVKILETELEAALLNPSVARRFDEGVKIVVDKAKEASRNAIGADAIEMQCDAVIEFVDSIFGAGSAKKVFGNETDLLTCLEAFKELTELYEKQVNPVIKQYSESLISETAGQDA